MLPTADASVKSAYIVSVATQAERREGTRARIVDHASEFFATRGYNATSVDDIIAAAGISKGAMYHHFQKKEDVFAAVFVATSSDAIRRAAAKVKPNLDPLDALVVGCLAWLDAVESEPTRRILLVDGPSVLGWDRARTLEEATSLGAVRGAVTRAVKADAMNVPSIDLAARLINGVLTEAALNIRPGDATHRRRLRGTVEAMIRGLSTVPR